MTKIGKRTLSKGSKVYRSSGKSVETNTPPAPHPSVCYLPIRSVTRRQSFGSKYGENIKETLVFTNPYYSGLVLRYRNNST